MQVRGCSLVPNGLHSMSGGHPNNQGHGHPANIEGRSLYVEDPIARSEGDVMGPSLVDGLLHVVGEWIRRQIFAFISCQTWLVKCRAPQKLVMKPEAHASLGCIVTSIVLVDGY